MKHANNEITIRKQTASDVAAVMEIVKGTGFFRVNEYQIALEVLEEAAAGAPQCTYQSFVSLNGSQVTGWVCLGETPCTIGTFDIYWIAVDAKQQGKGIGSKLLSFAQDQIVRQKGRLAVIETSGSDLYAPTQHFYESNGYYLAARIKDFYAVGDDKLIFIKSYE